MLLRSIYERSDVEVVAINGLMDAKAMVYLTKYDSTQGRFPGHIVPDDDAIILDGRRIPISRAVHPGEIDWRAEPEVVVESTGVFNRKSSPKGGYGDHLRGSVKRVVLTAPAKDSIDRVVVLGVNDDCITPLMRMVF